MMANVSLTGMSGRLVTEKLTVWMEVMKLTVVGSFMNENEFAFIYYMVFAISPTVQTPPPTKKNKNNNQIIGLLGMTKHFQSLTWMMILQKPCNNLFNTHCNICNYHVFC